MTDSNVIEQTPWADRQLSEAQQRNRDAAAQLPVTTQGALPQNFAQMADYCSWMARSASAVPTHLHGNPGACIAVVEMAMKWGFPAYQVARQTYVVNGVMAFQGALILAVINRFAPLRERLKFKFEGDGDARVIHVIGQFKDEAEPSVYTSPPLSIFKGTGKSPLWRADPDQQMIYLAARRWQLRYWPEGLFGIYSPEELEDHDFAKHVGADNAKEINPTATGTALLDRLRNTQQQAGEVLVEQGDAKGFNEANVNTELDGAQANGVDAKPPSTDAPAKVVKAEPKKTTKVAAELPKPKNVADWVAYTLRWIELGTDGDAMMKRWRDETKLRNACGVTEEERDPVFEKLTDRAAELPKPKKE